MNERSELNDKMNCFVTFNVTPWYIYSKLKKKEKKNAAFYLSETSCYKNELIY